MKYTFALLSVLGAAAAQGVTEAIAPKGSYPAGCTKSLSGPMWVSVLDVKTAKRGVQERASGACAKGNLMITLSNGVLTDSEGRTGYIASNYQFQFDAPAQAGAIYTAGFSSCANNTLALGATTTFYQCRSGDFWNLYDRSWAAQCEPVQLAAYPCSASGGGSAGQVPDGQVVATQMVTTTIVKPIADGQPQVITTAVPVPMCQIGDGQVQAHTTPCASITVKPPPPAPSTAAPVSQYTDGQIQVTPPATGAHPPPPATGSPAPPPATTAAPPPGSSTLVPTTKPSSNPSSPASSAPSAPSAPAQSNAGRLAMGSFAALVVGLVGVVAFL